MRKHDDGLAVDVSRIVGYRASCACGLRSRTRRTVVAARRELRELHDT